MARGKIDDARDLAICEALDRGEKRADIARRLKCSEGLVSTLAKVLREIDSPPDSGGDSAR